MSSALDRPDAGGATGSGIGAPPPDVARFSSGGPWEEKVGYSRAVAAGPFVFTAGCTAIVDGQIQHEGDPYRQTITAFRVAEAGLAQAGCSLADVISTTMYVTHLRRDEDELARAHQALFAAVRPVNLMVEVAALIDTRMLVEVQVTAYRRAG